jgi:1-acyl-sn-glycerol-3-phosphate acyltransferase
MNRKRRRELGVSSDRWAVQQITRYRWRRRILRDFQLRQIGFRVLVKPHVQGLENIPAGGATILMMNHTIAIDGVIVLGVIPQRDVIPVLKAENLQGGLIGFLSNNWGAVGIQRGEVDREALRTILELLELEQVVLIAPEGTRQKQLMRPKDGLVYIALKSDSVIVPTAIFNGDRWVHDLFRPHRTHIQVRFGKPFTLKKTTQRRVSREEMSTITDEMMYQLSALLPETYRGEYADLSRTTTSYLEFPHDFRGLSQST